MFMGNSNQPTWKYYMRQYWAWRLNWSVDLRLAKPFLCDLFNCNIIIHNTFPISLDCEDPCATIKFSSSLSGHPQSSQSFALLAVVTAVVVIILRRRWFWLISNFLRILPYAINQCTNDGGDFSRFSWQGNAMQLLLMPLLIPHGWWSIYNFSVSATKRRSHRCTSSSSSSSSSNNGGAQIHGRLAGKATPRRTLLAR